ncbi:bifunctional oligoribonuclease/PAP phosphatase NrnA [candidate division CSSED10-310 bacterium]|uniref:Bifunctional oligoribonuclease/PAP phosphatase NrnA n=1 Tax=candidate division CSSED10-310 bacterium TaxID=2855610 RepID=A0ABV6YVJ0_UNCC1
MKEALLSDDARISIITNIIEAMVSHDRFLIVGHKNPDGDCIGAMVALGLILSKFNKHPFIHLHNTPEEHFHYLLNFCRHHSICALDDFDTTRLQIEVVVACDTPKLDMLDVTPAMNTIINNRDVLVIEVDHHLGADAGYIGDEGYCLVDKASSTCELVGELALSLRDRKELLQQHQLRELFTGNLVLAILTGMITDTDMGKFLNTDRERRSFHFFSTMYGKIAARETEYATLFSSLADLSAEIQQLSSAQERCFNKIMDYKKFSPAVGYVVVPESDMNALYEHFSNETVVAASRAVANVLCEESGKFGLIAYYDNPEVSDLLQFRVRRSPYYKRFDLRALLTSFAIKDGGGHEGAIAFRFPRGQINDVAELVNNIITAIEDMIPGE